MAVKNNNNLFFIKKLVVTFRFITAKNSFFCLLRKDNYICTGK